MKKSIVDIEEIAEKASKGEDVSKHFGKSVKREPLNKIQRVNVDFPLPMLSRLDDLVAELGTGRQAVIKMAVMTLMDKHSLATKNTKA